MEQPSLSPPLLTFAVAERLVVAQDRGEKRLTVSLDLGRSTCTVETGADDWNCPLGRFPTRSGSRNARYMAGPAAPSRQ